jgi:hypothetical protein
MSSPDPSFRKEYWTKLIKQHLPSKGPLDLVILKGHLIVEQQLTAIIEHYCVSPGRLDKISLGFRRKLQLARALTRFPVPEDAWRAIEILNAMRNGLAHDLESPNLPKQIEEARALINRLWVKAKNRLPPLQLDSEKMVIHTLVGLNTEWLKVIHAHLPPIQ